MQNVINDLPQNLLCFSHLRWDFVFQRPQHLLGRLSKQLKVFFWEEPVFEANRQEAELKLEGRDQNILLLVPHLPHGLSETEVNAQVTALLDSFLQGKNAQEDFAFWYYSPMALTFSGKHTAKVTIYDCMDELSAFKYAPKELKDLEKKLLSYADVVFTGGQSLYEAKKHQHGNIHAFPSSIEQAHFAQARKSTMQQPADQQAVTTAGPKLGFYGVLDERFDIDLIKGIAEARPDWQLMLIGPVVKIDPQSLPQLPNIHYLGQKNYQQLPGYLAGWDIALIPFALNESTRFISPTKTPEYLAAGRPVVSTPIRDVVSPYGTQKLVRIADDAEGFVEAIEQELQMLQNASQHKAWLSRVDAFLKLNSWDKTAEHMLSLISQAATHKNRISKAS
jgi:glycosyltransferase involved in cell wall biosynthesis